MQHDTLALGLLRAAHRFRLPGLLGLCERALVASVGVRSCVRFYCVAEEVGAASLLDYCSGLISSHWDDLMAQDFEHMSGNLLFKMLKSKTPDPLHAAVRLLREDVVFISLLEYSRTVSWGFPQLDVSPTENNVRFAARNRQQPVETGPTAARFGAARTQHADCPDLDRHRQG